MVAVILSAFVSIGIAAFALAVITREFRGRGAQIWSALMFDEQAFVRGDLTPAVSEPRPARVATARVRQSMPRRAAA